MRLLLVEDVAVNRELVKTVLAPSTSRSTPPRTASQAIEAFRQRDYDLVLMDVQMPVMDGLTATAPHPRAADPAQPPPRRSSP